MSRWKWKPTWIVAAALVTGVAIADLSNNNAVAFPSDDTRELLDRFSTQPNGTVVSIIDGTSGMYVNWTKDGDVWVEGEGGYSPAHNPHGGSGSGGDPSPGGNGGSSGPSGPSSSLCPTCSGTVEVGPVTKAPT